MNYIFVALAVILIVVIYILYAYVFKKKTNVLSDTVSLNTSNSPVALSTLTNAGTAEYSYSLWIYLISIPTSIESSFTSVPQDITGAIFSDSKIQIFVTKDKGLEYMYLDNDMKYYYSIMTFKQSLPIQQWFHLCIIVNDTNNIDTYVNGKLTTSIKPKTKFLTPGTDAKLTFGSKTDAYIAGLERKDNALTSTDVWELYMKGNNESFFSKFLPYGLSLVSTKNQVDSKQYTLI